MFRKNVFIDGNFICRNHSEIIKSSIFTRIFESFLEERVPRDLRLNEFVNLFPRKRDIINLLLLLTHHKYTELRKTDFEVFCSYLQDRELFYYFLEKLYHYWRTFNRFIIKRERYLSCMDRRLPLKFEFTREAERLKLLVLETFRTIAYNGTGNQNFVFRQTTAGAEIGFLIDSTKSHYLSNLPANLADVPLVWHIIMEQPIIYYTLQNKRSGRIKITEKDYFAQYELQKKNFFAFPLWVGDLLILAYVNKDFLHLGASLGNLFEIADLSVLKKRAADGVFIFGAAPSFFDSDEQAGLVKIYRDRGLVAGFVPYTEDVDYFGYMKKSILTIHNVIQMYRGHLPIHGAMVRIILKDNTAYNFVFVGDSGAGKSETISALLKYTEAVKHIRVIVDDMGTLRINERGEVVCYGTEIGAFIRLDDLETGFAFSELDRSIFMNPNKRNARVIIPFATYPEVIAGFKIDALFYANNYEPVSADKPAIEVYDDISRALQVFREGKRLAKGTTNETGLTSSYFGNPFGAVQLRELHQKIEEKIFGALAAGGIPVGVMRTQLGLPNMEKEGPLQAARALLDFITAHY